MGHNTDDTSSFLRRYSPSNLIQGYGGHIDNVFTSSIPPKSSRISLPGFTIKNIASWIGFTINALGGTQRWYDRNGTTRTPPTPFLNKTNKDY